MSERSEALTADGPWTIELGRDSVVINGQDLSSHCRSVSVHHGAHRGKARPEISLELVLNYDDRLSFVDGADVGVDRRTERLLRDLGWTAPGVAQPIACGTEYLNPDGEGDGRPCVRPAGHDGLHEDAQEQPWAFEG